MKAGLMLLGLSAVLFYFGIEQIVSSPQLANSDLGYPLGFLLGSITPALVALGYGIRQLVKAWPVAPAPAVRAHRKNRGQGVAPTG